MTARQLRVIKADLRRYLRRRTSLLSPEFSAVVADVSTFTSTIVRDGCERALAKVVHLVDGFSGRPFIEVAEVIVAHYLPIVHESERDTVRKSLLEGYIHAAGPRYVLAQLGQTRLLRSLRRWGPRKFAALLLSLHGFNVVALAIQDDVRRRMPDVRSFELYMQGVETICRDAVNAAVKAVGTGIDEFWIEAVAKNVDARLLDLSFPEHPNNS